MKIFEVITALDVLKRNAYEQPEKVRWLSRLDALVKRQIIDTHEGGDAVTFTGYDESTDMETELLVPAPYDEMYLRYMEAQIDYANGEYGKYNNAILMFDKVFSAYRNHYNREHMPIGKGFKYF